MVKLWIIIYVKFDETIEVLKQQLIPKIGFLMKMMQSIRDELKFSR